MCDLQWILGCCGVVDVGCATDELWSTPDRKRVEHDLKQRVGVVLSKFYSVSLLFWGICLKFWWWYALEEWK